MHLSSLSARDVSDPGTHYGPSTSEPRNELQAAVLTLSTGPVAPSDMVCATIAFVLIRMTVFVKHAHSTVRGTVPKCIISKVPHSYTILIQLVLSDCVIISFFVRIYAVAVISVSTSDLVFVTFVFL